VALSLSNVLCGEILLCYNCLFAKLFLKISRGLERFSECSSLWDFFLGGGGENFFVTSFARIFICEEGELTCGGFFLARASFRML
jgi:hypothetical protein